jgi:A/G-specific adenine glycosylase
MVERHGGAVPDALTTLKKLPGVGGYTARAVLAFAFEQDVAVVDTNVSRVLARAVAGSALESAQSQALADSLVPPGRSWLWNQALMEIGAVACVARVPRCSLCPLRRRCRWNAAGLPLPDPGRSSSSSESFVGSDRQGRGRLVEALRGGPLSSKALAAVAGWPHDPGRARRVVSDLVRDGLARRGPGGVLRLP